MVASARVGRRTAALIRDSRVVFPVLLVLLALGAFIASQPQGYPGLLFANVFPFGLATAILALCPRAHVSYFAAVVALVSILAILGAGAPFAYAAGVALSVTVGSWITRGVASWRRRERVTLSSEYDYARMIFAVGVGAVTTGLLAGLVWPVGDSISFAATFVAIGSVAFAGNMVALPVVASGLPRGCQADWPERSLMAIFTTCMTVLLLVPREVPGLIFLLLPLMAWTAIRATVRQAAWQILGIALIAMILTRFGYGPYADVITGLSPTGLGDVIVLVSLVVSMSVGSVPLGLALASQRRRMGKVIREQERSERIISSADHTLIIGLDPDGYVTSFSSGAEKMLGYQETEAIGHPVSVFMSDQEARRICAEVGSETLIGAIKIASAQTKIPLDTMFICSDGQERVIALRLAPLQGESGDVDGYVGIGDDVTQRLEAQSALASALDAQRRAVSQMEEAERIKDGFISTVSHELRTPVTSIVGFVELIEDESFGTVTNEQRGALNRVASNGKRLLDLVDDLLTVSRLDARIAQDRPDEIVDLVEASKDALGVIGPQLSHRRLSLVTSFPDEQLKVLGDKLMLERVTINLLGNAIKFTPDGGEVSISLSVEGDAVALEVADTGIGIPVEEQGKLFERFFRSSLAEESAIQGTGLGLSIVAQIVDMHGGTIAAASAPGVGTTFRVELPRVAPLVGQHRGSREVASGEPPGPAHAITRAARAQR